MRLDIQAESTDWIKRNVWLLGFKQLEEGTYIAYNRDEKNEDREEHLIHHPIH